MPKTAELKREKKFLEDKLNVSIRLVGKKITVEGDSLNEYDAIRVLEAMNYGFSARTAASIIDEAMAFEIIHLKEHARGRNLSIVRSRLIGTHGKTRKTIEEIANCEIKIREGDVAIIAYAEDMQYIITAIVNIIKGSKQQNLYKYLERINTQRKQRSN